MHSALSPATVLYLIVSPTLLELIAVALLIIICIVTCVAAQWFKSGCKIRSTSVIEETSKRIKCPCHTHTHTHTHKGSCIRPTPQNLACQHTAPCAPFPLTPCNNGFEVLNHDTPTPSTLSLCLSHTHTHLSLIHI